MNVDDFAEIETKLDRILELLETRRDEQQTKSTDVAGGCQNDQSHLHGTSCVIQAAQRPDSGIQIHIDPHHVIGATIHELRRQGRLR